jgi:hypothetical protein
VRKEDLIAYARRDWQAIALSKRQRWAEQKSQMSAADALRVGDALRQHAIALRKGWPSEEDRRNDLASHIRVSDMVRSVKPPEGR